MGIEQLILENARNSGIKIGEKRGEKIGEKRGEKIGEKRAEERAAKRFVTSLIKNTDFPDTKIATIAGVSPAFVQQLKAGMKK